MPVAENENALIIEYNGIRYLAENGLVGSSGALKVYSNGDGYQIVSEQEFTGQCTEEEYPGSLEGDSVQSEESIVGYPSQYELISLLIRDLVSCDVEDNIYTARLGVSLEDDDIIEGWVISIYDDGSNMIHPQQ